jgi:exonuclease-1
VDGYGWLHRGAVVCAMELAQGKPTRKYVDFAMHRVRMFKHFGVTPYLVFDGDFLPSKAKTEASRSKRREESRKIGLELLRAGKPSQAYAELQKAIDVTPEMARHLIEELKKADVPYVVAPYEADSQLVYLERQGLISGIVSEDSDLLVFGAKRLLTKMDQHGQCIEINRRDFCAVREISLTGWTDNEFRHMAIFSGCDYLDGVNNIGLKTAYRLIRKHKTPERIIKMLRFDGKHQIPDTYLQDFKQAELTFLHQRVFCPKKRDIVLLTDPEPSVNVDDMPFIGAPVETEMARSIAAGDVNPITKQRIVLPRSPGKRRISQALAPASGPPRSLSVKWTRTASPWIRILTPVPWSKRHPARLCSRFQGRISKAQRKPRRAHSGRTPAILLAHSAEGRSLSRSYSAQMYSSHQRIVAGQPARQSRCTRTRRLPADRRRKPACVMTRPLPGSPVRPQRKANSSP